MNDPLRETLERVHELSARVGKHQQIRVLHWVRTLLAQPTSNGMWMRNVVAYATALFQMLQRGVRLPRMRERERERAASAY